MFWSPMWGKLRSNWRHNKTPTQILPDNSGHSKSWFANFRILLHNGNRKFNVGFILIIIKFRYLTFYTYIMKLTYLINNLPVCDVLKLLFWDNTVLSTMSRRKCLFQCLRDYKIPSGFQTRRWLRHRFIANVLLNWSKFNEKWFIIRMNGGSL